MKSNKLSFYIVETIVWSKLKRDMSPTCTRAYTPREQATILLRKIYPGVEKFCFKNFASIDCDSSLLDCHYRYKMRAFVQVSKMARMARMTRMARMCSSQETPIREDKLGKIFMYVQGIGDMYARVQELRSYLFRNVVLNCVYKAEVTRMLACRSNCQNC